MNHALKPSFVTSNAASRSLLGAVSFFHSSFVLERKRRSPWNYGGGSYNSKRCDVYAKRRRKMESRKALLRDVSEYAEYLFQSWKDDSSTIWFRRPYWSKGAKLNGFSLHESQSGRCKKKRMDRSDFCESDDDDIEKIFHSAFRRERFYYWASNSGNFHWRCSDNQSHSDWRYETDEETDEETDGKTGADTCPQPNLASERLMLGLSASGPLKLEEVKTAYRTCALRWHPDRHQGTSKVMAEEKFKNCSTVWALKGSATCPRDRSRSREAIRLSSLLEPLCYFERHIGYHEKVMAEENFKNCSTAYKSLCDRLAATS